MFKLSKIPHNWLQGITYLENCEFFLRNQFSTWYLSRKQLLPPPGAARIANAVDDLRLSQHLMVVIVFYMCFSTNIDAVGLLLTCIRSFCSIDYYPTFLCFDHGPVSRAWGSDLYLISIYGESVLRYEIFIKGLTEHYYYSDSMFFDNLSLCFKLFQEIALYGEFSIKETMMYFGWIFGMETTEINDRLQFLLNFLDLPSQNRLVKNLR